MSEFVLRSGLPCRRDCGVVFHPVIDTVEAIGNAALERNDHEFAVHGYHHVATDFGRPDWQRPAGRRGKVRI